MAVKEYMLDEQTSVHIYKRAGSRGIRLSIGRNGDIRVTLPSWLPYTAGLEFARSKTAWIAAHRKQKRLFTDGMHVGKQHKLLLQPTQRYTLSHRIVKNVIHVSVPAAASIESKDTQQYIEAAIIKALRKEAEALLPQRLDALAVRHGFQYKSVRVKRLKSRWGSCDSEKNIVLNLFLMLLPWDCIDYVLLHELTHTRVMQHGQPFWTEMKQLLPHSLASVRKQMRQHEPSLHGPSAASMT